MKYAHIDENNKLLGWYADDIHGEWIEPVYENRAAQEEEKDNDVNIVKEQLFENVLIKDGFYDITKIPIPNIEVADEVWQEAININANCYENGKFINKDYRTLSEVEKQRVETIKYKAGEIINTQYPLYKQLNITNLLDGYVQEDKTKMIDFINSIRAISSNAELEETALEDIDWGIQ